MMGFLAPLMLVGTIAIAVPIAIHLIGRRRARVVRFAALDFLLATKRRTARRLRLRERLLLAIRALVCLAIAIALAKPFTSCTRKGPQVTRGPQAAVIVIDDSFASGYVVDGRPWLRGAADEARRILTQLGPEAEVAIVRTSQGAELPGELTRDHIRLRDQLRALEPSARPADTSHALATAAQLLAASSHRRKTVYLISLLARSGFAGDPPWGKAGPGLVVVDLRPPAMPNVAVTALRVAPDPTAGSRGLAFDAEVGNFSDAPAQVELALSIANRVVARGEVDVPAGEKTVKRFIATLPANTRATEAAVAITHVPDGAGPGALAIDDTRWVRAHLRDEVRVLLVDGDPRTVRHDDELFYLEAALRPGDREDSGTQVRSITAEELAGIDPKARARAGAPAIDLGDFDVVVLANVPALPPERVAILADWVRAGGGILIAPGDRVDAAAYDRTMLPILPQNLADPIDTTWGAAPGERASRALHLVKWEADHPIFAPFSKDAPELADATFYKISLLGPTTNTLDRKVLARFTNGAAALVEASIGAGHTLLFTSTLDRDWNDLPIHPGYLPLVQQAVRHLARKHAPMMQGPGPVPGPEVGNEEEHLVGSSVVLPTADLKKLEVRGPDGIGEVYDGDRIEGRSSVRFTRTDVPGVYRVTGTDQTGATHVRPELSFVVNVDPRGMDLAKAPASVLPPSGAGGGATPEDGRRRVELWHAIAALVLVLLLAEGVLVQK